MISLRDKEGEFLPDAALCTGHSTEPPARRKAEAYADLSGEWNEKGFAPADGFDLECCVCGDTD